MRTQTSILAAMLAISFVVPEYTAQACEKHSHETAPISKSALPSGSIYHLNSDWKNQSGVTQKFSALAGRPRLIAMVFTRCQTACPVLVKNIKSLDTDLPVDLFSFDSERETAQTMQEFLKKYKLEGNRWSVHTSSKENIAELAATLGIQYKKLASGDFVHANVIFLIDEKGEVVAKYEGLGESDPAFLKSVKMMQAAR